MYTETKKKNNLKYDKMHMKNNSDKDKNRGNRSDYTKCTK